VYCVCIVLILSIIRYCVKCILQLRGGRTFEQLYLPYAEVVLNSAQCAIRAPLLLPWLRPLPTQLLLDVPMIGAKEAQLVQHEGKAECALVAAAGPVTLRALRSGQNDDNIVGPARAWVITRRTRAKGPATLTTAKLRELAREAVGCAGLERQAATQVVNNWVRASQARRHFWPPRDAQWRAA
jgi:hypothetical protein